MTTTTTTQESPLASYAEGCTVHPNYIFLVARERVARRHEQAERARNPPPKPFDLYDSYAPNPEAADAVVRRLLEAPPLPPEPRVASPISALDARHLRDAPDAALAPDTYHRAIGYVNLPTNQDCDDDDNEANAVLTAKQAWAVIGERAARRHQLETEQIALLEQKEADDARIVDEFMLAEQQRVLAQRNEADGTRRRKLPALHHFQQRRQMHTVIDMTNPTRPVSTVERVMLLAPASEHARAMPRTDATGKSLGSHRFVLLDEFATQLNVSDVQELEQLGVVEEKLGESVRMSQRSARPLYCVHNECAGKQVHACSRGLCDRHRKQLGRLSKKAMKSH
jgi:hypothetical protein